MEAELKVVILSAGQGKRLSPLTDDKPKCLRVQLIEGLGWAEMDFPADMARNLALTERWAARAKAS